MLLMANKKTTKSKAKKKQKQPVEPDSVFFLKLIFYFILGAIWIRLIDVGANEVSFSVPIGLFIGILFARHEHFMIDRKIEYVVLLVAMVLSFYLPVGILIG